MLNFVQRKLDITFTLGTKTFGEDGSNTVKLSGLRTSAKIDKAGGAGMSTLDLEVYGMSLSMMNKLSTLGMIATTLRRNSIILEAGDDESGMGTAFIGTITNAYSDMQGAPDVPFRVSAQTGLIEAIAPAEAVSYPDSADVAVILAGIANRIGVPFENNGVSVILSNPYFHGSLRNQALACVEAAGIEWNGMEDGTLAIWNPGEARGGQIPLISPDTGMVGYPTFTSMGIMVTTVYNPSVMFGGKIKVESSLEAASGTWVVFGLNHDLESKVPNGRWFSTIHAAPLGLGPFTP